MEETLTIMPGVEGVGKGEGGGVGYKVLYKRERERLRLEVQPLVTLSYTVPCIENRYFFHKPT